MKRLTRSFYRRPTVGVAKNLLGCFLVRKIGRKMIRAKITETEAYVGEEDLACHASRGRTARTETMYGAPGHAYVYMIYGMYHCLNIVTEQKNFPAAVLIRAVEIDGVPHRETDGPGKFCRFLGIDRKLNGFDVTEGEKLWIESGAKIASKNIRTAKRIGVDYAKHCKEYLWRFSIADYSK
ncbi:MAG: 3-methyladenine DNA glycosylase [Candidatus Moranbacteria bacterium RIFCSPHIGHO2_01_FULL_54_31]|nr:MAG: 3-methyladenine DNA glycosylase [Candidatus Moranbacteria bacterium RIFCSPHIGHO2_01_FULL_54_31]